MNRIAVFSCLSCFVFVSLFLMGGGCGPGRQAGEPPAIRPAGEVASQEAAVAEFREVDQPLLQTADRWQVTRTDTGETTTVSIGADGDIGWLCDSLRTSANPPGGGLTWAELTAYRGDRLLRTVWLFETGEWGLERPGTSWTTGFSPELVTRVKRWMAESESKSDSKSESPAAE